MSGGGAALVCGADLVVVAGQLGRRPQAMSAVAGRCPFGFPAVVEDLPYDGEGRPFPTLYYCTCPTLVAAVARLESSGGVAEWTRRLAEAETLARSVAAAAAQSAARRRELVSAYGLSMLDGGESLESGVGGVRGVERLGERDAERPGECADGRAAAGIKCLHAHVAHAIAQSGYSLGEAIIAELTDQWCNDRRCAVWLSDAED